MQIQRMIEDSMVVCGGEVRGHAKDAATMKEPTPLADSPAASSEPARKFVSPNSAAIGSFLHGTETSETRRATSDEKSASDRIVYATIDRLALKRTRLPLQLVPIDDDDAAAAATATVEKKERINGDGKAANGNRKTSPRRPSFKVRPGVPASSVQWKSRSVRPSPRVNQMVGKFETVSKDLASRLIIFENIIRNGDSRETFERRAKPQPDTDQEVPETVTSRDKNSSVIHPGSPRDFSVDEEIADRADARRSSPLVSQEAREAANTTDESNVEDTANKDESLARQSRSSSPDETTENQRSDGNDEYFESKCSEIILSSDKRHLDSCSTSTSESSITNKTKRHKREFAFAKNVLNYVPIASNTRRAKKSSLDGTKNRIKDSRTNLETCKSISREDLRQSISLPTNFVHLASATNSRLLPYGENAGNSSPRLITHEEKCARLLYLGGVNDDDESAKVAGKIVRNSGEKIEPRSLGNFTETGRSGGDEETSGCSTTTTTSSSSSSSLSLLSDDNMKRAKVTALENSQGAPEVVKRSENEGNYAETKTEEQEKSEEEEEEEEDGNAPVYEAMSEFSISTYGAASPVASAAAASRANASFLWGGRRAPHSFEKGTTSCGITGDEITPPGRRETDNSLEENDRDAYDDVGLSRDETEEDHYDDVGLPSTCAKNASTDILFEEIDAGGCELYDDVLPGPIGGNSAALNGITSGNYGDLPAIKSSSAVEISESTDFLLRKRSSSLSSENAGHESNENQYLSISNEYSSVEEGLNDFEGEEDDGLYDDVELPSQERVNSLYAGSSSGSQLGSLYNGKESEWEDLEESTPSQPQPKKVNVVLRNGDSQSTPSKKKLVHRWSRKVRRQKSKASRKNSAMRAAATRGGTSTFSVAVSLGTGSVLLVGSDATTNDNSEIVAASDSRTRHRPPVSTTVDHDDADDDGGHEVAGLSRENTRLQSRGLVQLRILGSPEETVDTQETSCYVLEDTASDDSNYETLFSYPSDEFSSSDDEDSPTSPASPSFEDSGLQMRVNGINQEAPSRPVPPPPRESSLTETFGKRMKMLRRTWSITKGSLGRMRRRTSTVVEPETSIDEGVKYSNGEQPQIPNGNDGKKYFSFKKHFKKSVTGLSTFYLDNENAEAGRLSRNNNCSKEEVYSDCSNNSWYTNTDYWKTGVVEQSRRNDVDHYSMLDEEPLYQFYAAAAARVAFESDSEGYEEVEDPMPSPSAVDLAKPGHRTLWCQTPQVIGSALLQRLTPDEKKMQEAKFEIFTSEASYLNSLRVLVDEFLNDHELVHEILTPGEREKLFGGVPSVLLASERLLAELETVWREDVMFRGLPDVLLNYAQRSSSVYVAYCSNQVSIDTTLKELRSKKGSKFVETVRRIETHPACQSLSLHSFLMLPMQRVTRLPLLADAVLSKVSSDNKDERTCWECVLSQLSQVVMECNEGARAAGRLAEMEALERKLEYSSKVPPIALRDRYLVRRGPVVQMLAKSDAEYKLTFGKKHHKASLYLLLLTDYLLIAKPKPNTNEETYTVIDTCKRSLVALEKVTEDSPFAGRHAMVLSLLENHSQRHVEYILTCKNATERERWLDAISPPKPSLVGETLYETWDCPQVMALYPYAAAQPDELTLQPGDVINVLRKMTDGWHLGEKLLGGEQGWFPGNYAKEVASEHVRARNLRQRHRLLALSASVLQQRGKLSSR